MSGKQCDLALNLHGDGGDTELPPNAEQVVFRPRLDQLAIDNMVDRDSPVGNRLVRGRTTIITPGIRTNCLLARHHVIPFRNLHLNGDMVIRESGEVVALEDMP